jgi:hypothetical protein
MKNADNNLGRKIAKVVGSLYTSGQKRNPVFVNFSTITICNITAYVEVKPPSKKMARL